MIFTDTIRFYFNTVSLSNTTISEEAPCQGERRLIGYGHLLNFSGLPGRLF